MTHRTGMDPIEFQDEQHRRRKSQAHSDTETGSLFDEPVAPKREPVPHVPKQTSSITSIEAAEKVAPVFSGNRAICLKEILNAERRGGTTRKMIADEHFNGKMNYTTGPIALLIEEDFAFEDPLRVNNEIQRRADGTPIPKRIDGSAVLLPTQKAIALARSNAAA